MKIMKPSQAAALISSGSTIIPGGFGSCGHPDLFTIAIEERFKTTGEPNNLTLLFASGAGDRKHRGLDRLAHPGLVSKAIGGFWNLCPRLRKLGELGIIEAHNWPQGVISRIFTSIADGSPGVMTKTGLNTFVDPRVEGGSFLPDKYKSKVELHQFKEAAYLFYPSSKIDFALLRGTIADISGNISLRDEASLMDSLAQAQATRNSGGKIFVQVREISRTPLSVYDVAIPAHLVDVVVVSNGKNHPFAYGYDNCPEGPLVHGSDAVSLARKKIIKRALEELPVGPYQKQVINFGIGIPAEVGIAMSDKQKKSYTLTVESGVIGGTPLFNDAFGASIKPEAIIDQSQLFTFYDGGGIDKAFLGFAQVDSQGKINVSKFNGIRPGAGGFINITMNAKELYFCGTLTARINNKASPKMKHGHSVIKKLIKNVEQITFDPKASAAKKIKLITEHAVFEIRNCHLVLVEISEDLELDELSELVEASYTVDSNLKTIPH